MMPPALRKAGKSALPAGNGTIHGIISPFAVYIIAPPLVGAGLAALIRAASVPGCVKATALCDARALTEANSETMRHGGGTPRNAVVLVAAMGGTNVLSELRRQREIPSSPGTEGGMAPSAPVAFAVMVERCQPDVVAQITGAITHGVRVFLTTDDTPETLRKAVEAAAQGQSYTSPGLGSVLGGKADGSRMDGGTGAKTPLWVDSHESETPRWAVLSERQREVALLAAAGLSNGEIGERLFIDITTVKTHLGDAYRKMGICRRSQLALHLTLSP